MQELVKRAAELLKDGTVARVLGWKIGDLPYNPEPAFFESEEALSDFVYNAFCEKVCFIHIKEIFRKDVLNYGYSIS